MPRALPSNSTVRRGFTLLELVVVLVIVGILATMATVGWDTFSWRIKTRGAMDELRNAIQLARSDATTRRRNSGIVIDVDSLRFLRFVDSSSSGAQNGLFDSGETVLQDWTLLPSHLVLFDVVSDFPPVPRPHNCDQPVVVAATTTQSGKYSIVFNSDGSSMQTFFARMRAQESRDTFRLSVVKATGWVTLDH